MRKLRTILICAAAAPALLYVSGRVYGLMSCPIFNKDPPIAGGTGRICDVLFLFSAPFEFAGIGLALSVHKAFSVGADPEFLFNLMSYLTAAVFGGFIGLFLICVVMIVKLIGNKEGRNKSSKIDEGNQKQ